MCIRDSYERITKGLQDAESHALRNRYTLGIYQQTGRLLNYPVRLLIGLENYDQANGEDERAASLKQIKKVCSYFKEMRAGLELSLIHISGVYEMLKDSYDGTTASAKGIPVGLGYNGIPVSYTHLRPLFRPDL